MFSEEGIASEVYLLCGGKIDFLFNVNPGNHVVNVVRSSVRFGFFGYRDNDYLLYQVQERVCENVPVGANGFYVLHLLSCNYVFKGYHSEQCAKEVAELSNKHPGVFADANNSTVRVSVNNGDEEALHDSICESIREVLGDEYEWR